MKFLRFAFLLPTILSCVLDAQENIPGFPNDNVGGTFHESPLTLGVGAFITDSLSVRGHLLSWNVDSGQWRDTLETLEHTFIPNLNAKICSELHTFRSSDGQVKQQYRTTVFNPFSWDGNLAGWPDSVLFDERDTDTGVWARLKKIQYQKSNDDLVFTRLVSLSNNIIPDTVENIFFDSAWYHRVWQRFEYDKTNDMYVPIDSTVYLYVDGRYRSYAVIDQRNGINKYKNRYLYEYYDPVGNYKFQTQFWSEDIDFWKFSHQLLQFYLPDENRIIRQYDTLTTTAWQAYKITNEYTLPDGQPSIFETALFPTLNFTPDTVYRKEYFFDVNSGFLESILTSQQIPPGDWVPFSKWLFDQPATVGLSKKHDHSLEDAQVRTLSNGIYQVVFPKSVVPASIYLLDSAGRLLLTRGLNNEVFDIDISSKPAGIYYLQVSNKNGFVSIPLFVS